MIRPLRRVHRVAATALAVALPVGLVLALRARVDWPLAPAPASEHEVPGARELPGLWGELPIATRVWPADASGGPRVELAPEVDLGRPDVLVYWEAESSASDDGAPVQGLLLGTLAGTRARVYDLPAAASETDGRLILYSLAHQEVVGTARLAAVGGS